MLLRNPIRSRPNAQFGCGLDTFDGFDPQQIPPTGPILPPRQKKRIGYVKRCKPEMLQNNEMFSIANQIILIIIACGK